MKTFSTSGTGSQQSLSEIENNKIPVYDTKTDAESDLANLTVGQIIATKDEGNETSTPVDVVQDGNMHAVTSNAVADSLSYSTSETLTGGKWADGKPIYRKTIIINDNIRNYMSIANIPIDTIVSASGMWSAQDGAKFIFPWVNANLDESFCTYYPGTTDELFIVYSKIEPKKIAINVEYTKTTD